MGLVRLVHSIHTNTVPLRFHLNAKDSKLERKSNDLGL